MAAGRLNAWALTSLSLSPTTSLKLFPSSPPITYHDASPKPMPTHYTQHSDFLLPPLAYLCPGPTTDPTACITTDPTACITTNDFTTNNDLTTYNVSPLPDNDFTTDNVSPLPDSHPPDSPYTPHGARRVPTKCSVTHTLRILYSIHSRDIRDDRRDDHDEVSQKNKFGASHLYGT